jgi:hypothetical protein
MTHNHTLLSHLRLLGSLSVAYYDWQGLRWKYSNPPTHGDTSIDTIHVLIPGISFRVSRISSSTSGVVDLCRLLLATRGAEFPCSQRRRWILTNLFLSGHFRPEYFSWYKRRTTSVLPYVKPYMKCILASSGFQYIVSAAFSYHTLNTIITVHFSY